MAYRLVSALCLVSLGACALPIARLHRNEPFRAANVVLPASGINHLVLRARVGDITLEQAPSDSLGIAVELVSHDAKRLERDCAPNSRLIQERNGAVLEVRIEQSTNNRCGERWVIQLPRQIAANIKLNGPGNVRGVVESADVDIDVELGDIDLVSRTRRVKNASVETTIGKVALEVAGVRIAPLKRYGPGAAAEAKGSGEATFRLRVEKGNVALKVE